ncbi:unnamed protein product [Menidia menidia]|uniref:(Atlantic silverside) hypothetical protein n=1 Tax=Menidia menidia TaxID=238744 RepID=A0A8S4AWU8_9TELE|nr:unnamed protein product [Menidia menidia]
MPPIPPRAHRRSPPHGGEPGPAGPVGTVTGSRCERAARPLEVPNGQPVGNERGRGRGGTRRTRNQEEVKPERGGTGRRRLNQKVVEPGGGTRRRWNQEELEPEGGGIRKWWNQEEVEPGGVRTGRGWNQEEVEPGGGGTRRKWNQEVLEPGGDGTRRLRFSRDAVSVEAFPGCSLCSGAASWGCWGGGGEGGGLKEDGCGSMAWRASPLPPEDVYSASHFALITAYQDIKTRLGSLERENSSIKRKLKIYEIKFPMISEFGEDTNSYCSFESKETALLQSENGNLQQRVNCLTHELQKRKDREEQLEDVIKAYEKIHMEKSNLQRDLDKMTSLVEKHVERILGLESALRQRDNSLQKLNMQLHSKDMQYLQLHAGPDTHTLQIYTSCDSRLKQITWETSRKPPDLEPETLQDD